MRHCRRDAAASDLVGTLLLVGLVVGAGSALAAVAAATLRAPAPPLATLALDAPEPGDAVLAVLHRDGEALPLDALRVRVSRGAGPEVEVARAAWTTPHPDALRPGDRLLLALSPALLQGEAVRVRVTHAAANALLGAMEARAGAVPTRLDAPTLAASFSPAATVADGTTATRLAVNVSHPFGALGVARVVADLSNVTNASGAAAAALRLADRGAEGDLVGGDGTWSALVALPGMTPLGTYTVPVHAVDLTGAVVASVNATVRVTGNWTTLRAGNATGGNGTSGENASANGTVTGGRCIACIVQGGVSAYEGTRLTVPTSANVSVFRLRNWTWDRMNPDRLFEDAMAVRVVNSSHAWSAYFKLGYEEGVPGIKSMVTWSAGNATTYVPRNGTMLPFERLDLNLMDPVSELQMVRASGTAHPNALYPKADIKGEPTFIVAYMRDEDVTGTRPEALDIGIFSVDVVIG